MTAQDRPRFARAMARAALATGAEVSEDRYEVYFEDLAHLRIERVEMAFTVCRRRSRFFPSIVEVRDAASGYDRHGAPPPRTALPAPDEKLIPRGRLRALVSDLAARLSLGRKREVK